MINTIMSKTHLISTVIENIQNTNSQEEKYEILDKYKKETILSRIISIIYNPWIDLKMQNFEPKRMGKKFGMGIARFLHIIEDIIDNKLDDKERAFSCNMALVHLDTRDAPLFVSLLKQELDLGLTTETINRVWPNLIMDYPLRKPTHGTYKDFNKFPGCVQPVAHGLRVNIIVNKDVVSYRNEIGETITGWEMYDQQFINLAQGQETVFDGCAVITEDGKIVSTDETEILGSDPANIRFTLWDVIRYDGFIKGQDGRIGYNWRYNGLEHMMFLAIEKNPEPCYSNLSANLVGSTEQLEATVKDMDSYIIKSLEGTWYCGITSDEIIHLNSSD